MGSNQRVYVPVYDWAFPGRNPRLHVSRLAEVVITGFDLGTGLGERDSNGNRGRTPNDCDVTDDDPWEHRCVSVVVVGQLSLSALVGDAAVDLIG